MRKSPLLIGAFILLGGASGSADSPSESFNAFRQQILSDFNSFKSRILEHYADFLNGEWHDFEPLWEEESPYTEPKPKSLPEAPSTPEPAPEPAVAKLPTPKVGTSTPGGVMAARPGGDLAEGSIKDFDFHPMKIDVPSMGGGSMPKTMAQSPVGASLAISDAAGKSSYELAVLRLPDPGFAFGSYPGQIAAPDPGQSGIVNIDMPSRRMSPEDLDRAVIGSGFATEETFKVPSSQKNFMFDFYGMEAFIPEIDFTIAKSVSSSDQTGAHWQKMADQEGGVETARQLFGLAQQLGLNGYLTYRLAEAYANQKFKDSDAGARMSAVHFLLNNMGYDVRLAKLGDRFAVMMPFDQPTVYSTMSLTMDGRKYTILYPDGYQPKNGESVRLSTCNLPAGGKGKTSDLRLTGLSLPMKAKDFTLTNGKLTLKGTVNENLQKILHRYPHLPVGDYASSWIDQKLREDLTAQLKEQLAGKTPRDAVNSLMNLCHKGFNYESDQTFHGFEKPYFLEENFLYDRNDCEDRAIFFSYLVWNALGLPCQLIQYPGHESATVAVKDDINGYFYETDGTKYWSADPTYIGSSIGMVQTPYRSTTPSIDKTYK